jgi:hypothetical protein
MKLKNILKKISIPKSIPNLVLLTVLSNISLQASYNEIEQKLGFLYLTSDEKKIFNKKDTKGGVSYYGNIKSIHNEDIETTISLNVMSGLGLNLILYDKNFQNPKSEDSINIQEAFVKISDWNNEYYLGRMKEDLPFLYSNERYLEVNTFNQASVLNKSFEKTLLMVNVILSGNDLYDISKYKGLYNNDNPLLYISMLDTSNQIPYSIWLVNQISNLSRIIFDVDFIRNEENKLKLLTSITKMELHDKVEGMLGLNFESKLDNKRKFGFSFTYTGKGKAMYDNMFTTSLSSQISGVDESTFNNSTNFNIFYETFHFSNWKTKYSYSQYDYKINASTNISIEMNKKYQKYEHGFSFIKKIYKIGESVNYLNYNINYFL